MPVAYYYLDSPVVDSLLVDPWPAVAPLVRDTKLVVFEFLHIAIDKAVKSQIIDIRWIS